MATSLFLTFALALLTLVDAFNASANNNVVLYWGQDEGGHQKSLSSYCKSNAADMYIISFLDSFSGDATNATGEVAVSYEGSLMSIGQDIKDCQALGHKVLVSLGGAEGRYGFSSNSGGLRLAGQLWDAFGGGTNNTAPRPFGQDVILDGFDLDIEQGNPVGYSNLVNSLRQLYKTDTSKKYFVSAAPQCPFPDRWVSEALQFSDIDFAFVQFYNNDCGLGDETFNYKQWARFARTKAANRNMKIYLGVPGSRGSASTGYAPIPLLKKRIDELKNRTEFGGVMMWDASSAFGNLDHGKTYVQEAKNALDGVVSGGNSTFLSYDLFSMIVAALAVGFFLQ